MSLDPLFVVAPSIQQYFVDKDTGLPLSGGYVYFYEDDNRTIPKPVFELSGSPPNYSYTPLPNPLILSAAGIPIDASGNPIVIYWFPYDDEGNVELYYVRITSATNVPQQTVQAWPNIVPSSGTNVDNAINYIPNGQFLAHTTPPDNAIVAGSNQIAQGGFTVEMPNSISSTNTIVFNKIGFNPNIPNSPRYLCNFTCTVPGVESFKIFQIKWGDVNKFSTNVVEPGTNQFTFAFWAVSTFTVDVIVQAFKNFGTGGSPSISIPLGPITITTTGQFFNFEFSFGTNEGSNIDPTQVPNDDYVAIQLLFPTGAPFNVNLTDFILSNSVQKFSAFPLQTNADMIARGVFGWADTPDGMGGDLFLPPILTQYGMAWDLGSIGDIGMSFQPVSSPTTTGLQHNKMPCDGATYITEDFSANGIPYSRLENYLNIGSPIGPITGTGSNYITALVPFSGTTNPGGVIGDRIVYNVAGTGSSLCSDGAQPTGWTFAPAYIYGGSTTGNPPTGIFSSNAAANQIWMVSAGGAFKFDRSNTGTGAGTGGWTFTPQSGDPPNETSGAGLLVGQASGYLITTLAAATLPLAGAGGYFRVKAVAGVQIIVWYNVDGGNVSPGVGGFEIQINVHVGFSAQDVADVTREALMGFNATWISVTGVPALGVGNAAPYFNMYSNPASLRTFFVWFTINGVGNIPVIPGATGLLVPILSTDSVTAIRDKIRSVLNRYQFNAPYMPGMFPRFADPNAIFDVDAGTRWSFTPRVAGANPGTYEYANFEAHNHVVNPSTVMIQSSSANNYNGGIFPLNTGSITTVVTGGNETRPVNVYVYPYIRY